MQDLPKWKIWGRLTPIVRETLPSRESELSYEHALKTSTHISDTTYGLAFESQNR